jgi:peptidoglycan/LPS O-acetylase OafA/YrhL
VAGIACALIVALAAAHVSFGHIEQPALKLRCAYERRKQGQAPLALH